MIFCLINSNGFLSAANQKNFLDLTLGIRSKGAAKQVRLCDACELETNDHFYGIGRIRYGGIMPTLHRSA